MTIDLKPLSEQCIVVLGASSGIGLATAKLAAKRGAKVFLAARSEDALAQAVREIREAGGAAEYGVADVALKAQVQAIGERAVATYGRIDTWVNVSGLGLYARLEEPSEEDNRRLFDTNFWGVVNGSLAALTYMRSAGGAIINLGSEASEAAAPFLGMYSASKHAVKGFTDALRLEVEELDRAKVAISLVQPTAVNTPFPERARNYMDREPSLPTPRIDPDDVAEAILDCATHHRSNVKVGAMAVVNTLVSKVSPALAAKMAAKQGPNMKSSIPPQNPEGTLYAPNGGGKVRGFVGDQPSRS